MKELTKAEEQVMQILWEIGKGFVKDVLAHFPEPKPAYNTVSTIIRILEKKEFVGYRAFGKSHEYYPLIAKEAYTKQELDRLVEGYFEGSPERLVSFFVKEKQMNAKDLDEILKIIAKNKTK